MFVKKLWKANPTGDGICLENSRALIAPLEFDSLAFRQNLYRKTVKNDRAICSTVSIIGTAPHC